MDSARRWLVNSPSVIHETIDGETVIIHFDRGFYYSLGDTGAEVWEGLRGGRTAPEIAAELALRYDGATAEIEAGVGDLLDQLRAEELVREEVGTPVERAAESGRPAAAPALGERAPFEAPVLTRYTDLQDFFLLDPVHDVEEDGWPNARLVAGARPNAGPSAERR